MHAGILPVRAARSNSLFATGKIETVSSFRSFHRLLYCLHVYAGFRSGCGKNFLRKVSSIGFSMNE